MTYNIIPVGIALTKSEVELFAQETAQQVLDGHASALETAMRLKFVEEASAAARKLIEDSAIREAEKYHKQDRNVLGVAFDVRSRQADLDYTSDSEIVRLQAEIDLRKKLLKAGSDAGQEVVLIDGEVVQVPVRKPGGSTSLYLTFPKS